MSCQDRLDQINGLRTCLDKCPTYCKLNRVNVCYGTLHFVPFHFVPGHFVPVALSPDHFVPGHFVSGHFVSGHFVPWSLCPRSLCPRSHCPLVTLSPGHFFPWSLCPRSFCPLVILSPVTLSTVILSSLNLSPIFHLWNDKICRTIYIKAISERLRIL
jgi:hypothetical protein